jgi:dipeptidyl aminopeptidase/acylaminoacyl peptidase
MKKFLNAGFMLLAAGSMTADTLPVESFSYYGPFPVTSPLMVDTVDVNGKSYSERMLDMAPARVSLKGLDHSRFEGAFPPGSDTPAVHMLAFNFENTSYATPELKVKGPENFTVYVDGRKTDDMNLALRPATHSIVVRYLSMPGAQPDSLAVSLTSERNAGLTLREDGRRRFSLEDVLHGPGISSVTLSPDGKYLMTYSYVTRRGGKGDYTTRITSTADGHTVAQFNSRVQWMPEGSEYSIERPTVEGNALVAVNPATGAERVIVEEMPENDGYILTPDCRKLIMFKFNDGRQEDPGVYEVLEPEDRQPGWRSRSSLAVYDIATGITSPLTFGNRNVWLNDISADSKQILIGTSHSRLTERPTTLNSLYTLNLNTMRVDTLVNEDGFISTSAFSPDGSKVLVQGTPEALDGIGRNLPEGRIPSMVDNQLYIIDVATRKVTPLTRDFNPSVENFSWSRADGQIYLTAEDRDCVNMFRIDSATGKITRIPLPEEMVRGFSLPDAGRNLAWYGESASAPVSLYLLDTRTLRSTKLDTPKAAQLADVELGTCEAWDFVNAKGDTICGRFYLPPDFDPSRKYPMIVNYYGGCSPTGRNFESRYPHNAYAAQGYVVYVLQPSGAAGFGQEFASRHVNTAGQGVADDIIEGTKKFCEAHPYVDASKIGCIGASYGGFMTQYLQTVTDIFAAAISHAGISDHTSYWGEGYWGYSYSEVSMANSYPWSEPDLYVKQSPLYNADKIHTPLLFLHGDGDTNVPVGESIQMFTALKLLGRPTAFVAVSGENHWITDYDKRIKWQDTIFAWFARYLKDDSSWWDAMYPATPL